MSNLFLLFYLFRLFDPLLQSYVPFAYFLKNHTKLRSGNIAHARPRIFPIEVFFLFFILTPSQCHSNNRLTAS